MHILRTFQPFAPAVLFRRARPADFLEPDMKFSPSNHHDRECLLAVTGRVPLELVRDARLTEQARYEEQDDMGEWAAMHAEGLRSGLVDASHLQIAEAERAQVLRETLSRLQKPAGCTGDCCDGVTPGDCTCGHSMAWRAPRQPRRPAPRRASRWGRLCRALVRWLLSPRAGFGPL